MSLSDALLLGLWLSDIRGIRHFLATIRAQPATAIQNSVLECIPEFAIRPLQSLRCLCHHFDDGWKSAFSPVLCYRQTQLGLYCYDSYCYCYEVLEF